jgi:hypothetical protein
MVKNSPLLGERLLIGDQTLHRQRRRTETLRKLTQLLSCKNISAMFLVVIGAVNWGASLVPFVDYTAA